MVTLDQIKQYTSIKKKLARDFKISEKQIQQIVDFLIKYLIDHGTGITSSNILSLAQSKDSILHDLFDWNKDLEYKITQAQGILNSIEFCISSNGVMYNINNGEKT